MALFARSRRSHLETKVDAMRDEIADLVAAIARRGSRAIRDGGHEAASGYHDVATMIAGAVPVLRRQSRSVGRQVRENPGTTAAAAGLLVLGIAALVWLGRR